MRDSLTDHFENENMDDSFSTFVCVPEILLKFRDEPSTGQPESRGKKAYTTLHTTAPLFLFDKKLSFICSESLLSGNFGSLFYEVAGSCLLGF